MTGETKAVLDELQSSARILIVDDDRSMIALYSSLLKSAGYLNVRSTPDPRGVLALFVEFDPDLLILDVMMPHLTGLQLLGILQHDSKGSLALPILVATAYPSPEVRYSALSQGAVEFLEKPFDAVEFVLRVRNLLQIRLAVRDVEAQTSALFQELLDRTDELSQSQLELKETQMEVIARLAQAAEQHDDETGMHTQRVAITTGLIALRMGLGDDEVEIIHRAAPLHDVGKIGVPDSILRKPGKLTSEEHAVMRRHCSSGAGLLAGGRSDIVQKAECIALSHHEKWNGTGYPKGLQAEQIPLEGRIVAVADVFDALTHVRPYKEAWSVGDALKEIQLQSGEHFDPEVVASFLELPHDDLI